MDLGSHKSFIKKHYEEYKKIGYVECPAFECEKIYFNKVGFNHLLWKGKKMRKPEEQTRRIKLISYAIQIISSSKSFAEYRENKIILANGSISHAYFWSFSYYKNKREIRVIIRQTNNSRKYFMSVM